MAETLLMMVAVFSAAFLRGLTGFGFALAAVPILSLVVEPLQAVIIVLLLQIAVAPWDLWKNYRHIDKRAIATLSAGAVFAAPIGGYFATRIDPSVMRLLVAVFVLMGLLAIVSNLRIRQGPGPAIIAGSISGLLGGLAAMPGPPAVAYFLGRGADKKEQSRASLLGFFAATACIALVSIMATSDAMDLSVLSTAAICLPVLTLGNTAGEAAFRMLTNDSYRTIALIVLLLSGIMTGAKGLQGMM